MDLFTFFNMKIYHLHWNDVSALTESQPYFQTGFIFGASFIVAPSTCQELDDTGNTEQNTQGKFWSYLLVLHLGLSPY